MMTVTTYAKNGLELETIFKNMHIPHRVYVLKDTAYFEISDDYTGDVSQLQEIASSLDNGSMWIRIPRSDAKYLKIFKAAKNLGLSVKTVKTGLFGRRYALVYGPEHLLSSFAGAIPIIAKD